MEIALQYIFAGVGIFATLVIGYVAWQISGLGRLYADVKVLKKSSKKHGKRLKILAKGLEDVKKESAEAHAGITKNIKSTEEKIVKETDEKIGIYLHW